MFGLLALALIFGGAAACSSSSDSENENIPIEVLKCYKILQEGNRPLCQLSNVARAIEMWVTVCEWDD